MTPTRFINSNNPHVDAVFKLTRAEILNIILGFIVVLLLLNQHISFSSTPDGSKSNQSIIDSSNDHKYPAGSSKILSTFIPTTSPTIKPVIQYREKCTNYLTKSLLNIDQTIINRNITLLTSFPGSGNTFARLLVEVTTGGFTGSIYTSDSDLEKVFEMESKCGLRMVAIKGHPDSFDVCGFGLCINAKSSHEYKKCKLGMIEQFYRFIFVVRNPIDSVFAEFQRTVTGKHNGKIAYIDVGIIARWQQESIRIAKEMSDGWKNIISPMMNRHSPQDFLVLKYENLVSKDKEERFAELMVVPQFLKLPYDESRIDCAFEIANAAGGVHRNSSLHYTSLLANNDELACRLWSLFRNYSEYFEYANPWIGLNCDPKKAFTVSDQCASYHERSYLAETSTWNRSSTLLTGFEGSGMSWVRALIEYSTGVYTGSIYSSDTDLLDVFPGEARCGLRLSVIKGYPSNFDLSDDHMRLNLVRGRSEVAKCKRGMLTPGSKFVIVARDPMKSTVASFQKSVTGQRTGIIKVIDDSVVDLWVPFAQRIALEFKRNWESKLLHLNGPKKLAPFHIVRYESLLSSSTRRHQELQSLASFLQFPSIDTDRITCAFELAESVLGIHRHSTWTFEDLMPKNITAYNALACKIWEGIEGYSFYFNYTNPWSKLIC